MKFINTLLDIIVTAVCMGIVAGFAYVFYISNAAQDFTFLMPSFNTISLNPAKIQGYAIAIIGIAIGVQLFKAAVSTDHIQAA